MTKKDYVAIAVILNYYARRRDSNVLEIASDLARLFAQDNIRFSGERFMEAVFDEKD